MGYFYRVNRRHNNRVYDECYHKQIEIGIFYIKATVHRENLLHKYLTCMIIQKTQQFNTKNSYIIDLFLPHTQAHTGQRVKCQVQVKIFHINI